MLAGIGGGARSDCGQLSSAAAMLLTPCTRRTLQCGIRWLFGGSCNLLVLQVSAAQSALGFRHRQKCWIELHEGRVYSRVGFMARVAFGGPLYRFSHPGV